MSHWLHAEAESELAASAVSYRDQASAKVARAFVDEFDRILAPVVLNQQLGTIVRDGLRSYPLRRFPYSIIYREADSGPRIYAIAHHRREPAYWQGRP